MWSCGELQCAAQEGTHSLPRFGKGGSDFFNFFVLFFLLFSYWTEKGEKSSPHLIFYSEKVVNMYCLRADKRAKKHKWKRLPVCRKREQRGNPPGGCVSMRSLVCGINRWRLSARRPIAAVPARILWAGAVPSETTQASCHGGCRRSCTSWKHSTNKLGGCEERNPVCYRISEAGAEGSVSFDCLLHLG